MKCHSYVCSPFFFLRLGFRISEIEGEWGRKQKESREENNIICFLWGISNYLRLIFQFQVQSFPFKENYLLIK